MHLVLTVLVEYLFLPGLAMARPAVEAFRLSSVEVYLGRYSCAVMEALIDSREGTWPGHRWWEHPALLPFAEFHEDLNLYWGMACPEQARAKLLMRLLALSVATDMRRKCAVAGLNFGAALEHLMLFEGQFGEDVEKMLAAILSMVCSRWLRVTPRTTRRRKHRSTRNSKRAGLRRV